MDLSLEFNVVVFPSFILFMLEAINVRCGKDVMRCTFPVDFMSVMGAFHYDSRPPAPAVADAPASLPKPSAPVVGVELVDKKVAPELCSLLRNVREGLQHNQRPEPVALGVNGTYFMKDKNGLKVAIFKPADEEFCGADSDGTEASGEFGLLPGETAVREAAAFRVAREHPDATFQNVPPTGLVRVTAPSSAFARQAGARAPASASDAAPSESDAGASEQPLVTKFGSLQAFVDADGDSDEFGPSQFPTEDVHKIGVLDLQILNCDRNAQNVLVKERDDGSLSLIPIDHGFSMPASLSLGAGRFEWLNYPAARRPFSAATLAYIEAIPVERVGRVLRDEMGVRAECVDTVLVANRWLKRAAAAGLTLYEIGDAACRRDIEEPSELETAYSAATAPDALVPSEDALERELDALVARKLAVRR